MTKEDEAPQEVAVDIAIVSTETNGHSCRNGQRSRFILIYVRRAHTVIRRAWCRLRRLPSLGHRREPFVAVMTLRRRTRPCGCFSATFFPFGAQPKMLVKATCLVPSCDPSVHRRTRQGDESLRPRLHSRRGWREKRKADADYMAHANMTESE